MFKMHLLIECAQWMNNKMSLIYLLLSISLLLFIKAKSSLTKHHHRLPPGPWNLPIIGSLHHFIRSGLPHRALRNLSQKYGHIMFLQVGERPTIVVSSIEGARLIIKTHETTFCNRPEDVTMKVFTFGGKNLVLAPFGEYWRDIRRIITSEFLSSMRVQSFQSIREEVVSDLVRLIASLTSRNQTINLSEMMSIMTNKIAIRAITGSKRKDATLLMKEIQRSGELATRFGVANLFPSSRLASLISSQVRKTKECHSAIDRLLENMIQEHRASLVANEAADDLLSVLLRLHDGAEKPISMDTVKALIFDAFGGGTDTTNTVLHWAMSELVRNPRAMKKAQDEIRQIKNREFIAESDLVDLHYLHLVLKETLRLHPVIPLIPRVCQEEFNISGYDVPKGATVVVNMWAIGRDPKCWKNPDEFVPERFAIAKEDDADSKGEDHEFFPFGAGRRNCPGKFFGSAVFELTLANLLYHFDWELPCGMKPDDLDMTEIFSMIVRRKDPLLLHAAPHTSV